MAACPHVLSELSKIHVRIGADATPSCDMTAPEPDSIMSGPKHAMNSAAGGM